MSQARELRADEFIVSRLQHDKRRAEDIKLLLIYILETETAQHQKGEITSQHLSSFAGPGIHFYHLPVEYATNGTHPECVIRCARLLDEMGLDSISPEFEREFRQFVTLLKEKR
jgi:hypothetical protein